LASVHGTYRRSEHTLAAIERVGRYLAEARVGRVTWYVDRPVSNSGRLAGWLRDAAEEAGWDWVAQVVPDPDPVLASGQSIVASSDAEILDTCERWIDLAGAVVGEISDAWVIDLGGSMRRT
jgi:hypothetical protein